MDSSLPYASTILIVPAYNEASAIGAVLAKIQAIGPWPIVVINDGSTDDTAALALAAGAKVCTHKLNRGPGAATMTGIAYAKKEGYTYAITIDGDDQHNPEDLPALLQPLLAGEADLVIGNRFMKGTNAIPRSRVLFNGIANLTTYLFSHKWVSDTQSGLKALGPVALERLTLEMDGYEFCSELIIKAMHNRLRVVEVPVDVHYSAQTMAKGQNLFTGIKTITNLFHHLMTRH